MKMESKPPVRSDHQLISINEVTRLLGIGRSNVYNRINKNEIEAVRIGNRRLVKLSSVEAFIDRASGAGS